MTVLGQLFLFSNQFTPLVIAIISFCFLMVLKGALCEDMGFADHSDTALDENPMIFLNVEWLIHSTTYYSNFNPKVIVQ